MTRRRKLYNHKSWEIINDKEQDKTLKLQESCPIFLHVCQRNH